MNGDPGVFASHYHQARSSTATRRTVPMRRRSPTRRQGSLLMTLRRATAGLGAYTADRRREDSDDALQRRRVPRRGGARDVARQGPRPHHRRRPGRASSTARFRDELQTASSDFSLRDPGLGRERAREGAAQRRRHPELLRARRLQRSESASRRTTSPPATTTCPTVPIRTLLAETRAGRRTGASSSCSIPSCVTPVHGDSRAAIRRRRSRCYFEVDLSSGVA